MQQTPKPGLVSDLRPPAPTLTPEGKSLQVVCVDGNRRVEIDGPSGPEPTRYGDWERNGRCVDF